MKHIHTFESFLNEETVNSINEGKLYGVENGQENEVVYNAIAKRPPAIGKKNKIKWKSEGGFERVACFEVTDIISNDLVIFKKYPGESFNNRDAKTNVFKKDFGIVSLSMHWMGGKLDPAGLPDDIVKLINDLGLVP
jgi:hypothetical protein